MGRTSAKVTKVQLGLSVTFVLALFSSCSPVTTAPALDSSTDSPADSPSQDANIPHDGAVDSTMQDARVDSSADASTDAIADSGIADSRMADASGELSANAGEDVILVDADGDTFAIAELDARASTGFQRVEWHLGTAIISTELQPAIDLAIGTHRFTLFAFDSDGSSVTDELIVEVRERSPGPQRLNLAETPTSPRFILPTGSQWPSAVGEAVIALWKDDRVAAFSTTIDDNIGTQHSFWRGVLGERNLVATWFVITGEVDRNPTGGTWSSFRALASAGNGLGSHGDSPENPASWNSARWQTEFTTSTAALRSEVPSVSARVLAHPWGMLDRAIVDDYFLAARGVRGVTNPANQIDYLNTASYSMRTATSTIELGAQDLQNIVARVDETLLPSHANRHGWVVQHFHWIDPSLLDDTRTMLDAIAARGAVWAATFEEVAIYGQERDTATVTVSSDERSILVDVRDQMADAIFDKPLTIKVRVPDEWQGVSATQRRQPIEAELIERAEGKFVLVSVVPDRGVAVLSEP